MSHENKDIFVLLNTAMLTAGVDNACHVASTLRDSSSALFSSLLLKMNEAGATVPEVYMAVAADALLSKNVENPFERARLAVERSQPWKMRFRFSITRPRLREDVARRLLGLPSQSGEEAVMG
jgi:hypothetical protein